MRPQQRSSHRAPDFRFLQQAFSSRFDNQLYPKRNCYGESIIRPACEEMSAFPKLITNAITTSAAMVAQNLTPFFHGEPPGWNAIRLFMNTLINSKNKKNYYKYFRMPSQIDDIERAELIQRIDQFIAENGTYHKSYKTSWGDPLLSPLDVDPGLRPHLLSVSYGIAANLSKFDSTYWFTFHYRKDVKKIENVFAKAVMRSLKMRGHSLESIAEIIKEMNLLFNEYAQLKVGTLAIIGVPNEKLSEYIYDSKSMGHPTGRNIQNIVDHPFAESTDRLMGNEGGLQARLLLYKETMTPNCGLQVILANDDDEVEKYVCGRGIKNPMEFSIFDKLLYRKHTLIEEKDKQHRRMLDAKVITIANQARHKNPCAK